MTGAVKVPALLAIEKSPVCGKRGPKSGAFCSRFKGHEQPPSPLLGADFHEARDSHGIIERWPVEESEAASQRFLSRIAPGARYAEAPGDSVEREIASAEAREHGATTSNAPQMAPLQLTSDPGPEPPPSTKEAEMDAVRELLTARGYAPVDQWKRNGAAGSGVSYYELRADGLPALILRVQVLFSKPVTWALLSDLASDLPSLRMAFDWRPEVIAARLSRREGG